MSSETCYNLRCSASEGLSIHDRARFAPVYRFTRKKYQLIFVDEPINTILEITEITDRISKARPEDNIA